MNEYQVSEPNKSSSGTIVLVAILMLLIGGAIGYFITKTYYSTKEQVAIEMPIVENSAIPTSYSSPINTLANDWKTESEKVVKIYLSPTASDTQEKIRTSNLNSFLNCIKYSKQASDQNSGHFINAEITLGISNAPMNPDVEIISSEKNNDQVIVKAKLTNVTFDDRIWTFYLIQKQNLITGNNEWLINDTNNTIEINPSDYECSR